eukprot:UN11394
MDSKFPLFTTEIDENLNVLDLKNNIYQQSPDKIIALRQRLIHKGRLLKDVRTLKQYNISNHQTIMLVRSRRNQAKNPQNITSLNKNKTSRCRAMTLNMETSKTPEPQQIDQIY